MSDPKEKTEEIREQDAQPGETSDGSQDEPGSYYYDDSHGYEDFDPELDEGDAESGATDAGSGR